MQPFKTMILVIVATVSIWYLFSYGKQVGQIWILNGSVELGRLDEVSLWFYRERGEDGRPASSYRLLPHLSVVDPLDGPNWEVRIPGWIPAVGALGALAFSALTLYGERERDVA